MPHQPGNPLGTSMRSVRFHAQHVCAIRCFRSHRSRCGIAKALAQSQLRSGTASCARSAIGRSGEVLARGSSSDRHRNADVPGGALTRIQSTIKGGPSPVTVILAACSAVLLVTRAAHAMDPASVSGMIAAVPESVVSAVGSQPVVQKGIAFIPGLIGDSPLREGIVSGFLLILFSELGDKTFFIAVLLALKESKGLVFAGTFGALAVMTVISVALGQLLHQLDELQPGGTQLPLDDILAVALLVFFGLKTINDARNADTAAAEEREEAEEEVNKLSSNATGLLLSTFALVFAAEWGDKSFLATIALAAASSPTGVVIGAVAGHGVATGIAVVGGSYLGKYLDEKVVQYVGGSLFLVFAAATVVDIIRGV